MTPLLIQMSAAQTIGKRDQQQDSVGATRSELQWDKGMLCTVADGMGGMKEGKSASQKTVDVMIETFHRSSADDTPEQILLRGCSRAQQAVLSMQKTPGESGTTLTAVLIREGKCSFLSVGDSRIYLCRNGAMILLTRDQNKAARIETQIALGYLPEEARSDRERNALTDHVGMRELTRADRSGRPFPLIPGDHIVLMTDGAYGALSEEEMQAALALPEDRIANTMIRTVEAKKLPRQDNATVAVMACIPWETAGR